MTLLKRTFTSLYSRIDRLVSEIENHDALIQAAIGEQKSKIADAKVQLRRLQSHEKRLKEQVAKCNIDIRRWSQRASQSAVADETKALACLERRQRVREQLEKYTAMLREYSLNSARIQSNIQSCEAELASMVQKHELFRARQSTADAMEIVNRAGAAPVDQLSSHFDRWEANILKGELMAEVIEDSDELEEAFISQEQEQALRHELAELLKANKLEEDLQ